MKLIKELISVKDYGKKHKITDAAVRKQINTNKINSVIYKEITYIVIDSNEKEKLKSQIKLKNATIKTINTKLLYFENQKERIIKLENKVEKLENKLEDIRDKKDELYEKVIGEITSNNRLLKMG